MRYALLVLILFLTAPGADAAEVSLKDGTVVVGTIISLVDGDDRVGSDGCRTWQQPGHTSELWRRYRMRWAADADIGFTVLPNLEESGRVRTQFDGSLSFDLFSDFDFKLTVYDRYDSQPPPGNEKHDTGVTLGLSWDY